MGRRLIGHHIRYHAPDHQLGIDLGGISNQPDRFGYFIVDGFFNQC